MLRLPKGMSCSMLITSPNRYVEVQPYEVKRTFDFPRPLKKLARKKKEPTTWAGAPNTEKGSAAICVRGDDCDHQGALRWGSTKDHEVVGGPQDYPFDEPFR